MNLNKLTEKSGGLLQRSQEIAAGKNNQLIEPEHLFAAMLEDNDSIINSILFALKSDKEALTNGNSRLLDNIPQVSGNGVSELSISREMSKILEAANREATAMKDDYVSAEHLLLGLAGEKNNVSVLLKSFNVTRNAILSVLKEVRGSQRVTSQNPEDTFQALEKYGRNLNQLASRGKLDPVIGREDEIRRVLQVLSRRTKNNPVLIGEPGVGKTAIAEGIAIRIYQGDIPESLRTGR